jgi:integrase-like protein
MQSAILFRAFLLTSVFMNPAYGPGGAFGELKVTRRTEVLRGGPGCCGLVFGARTYAMQGNPNVSRSALDRHPSAGRKPLCASSFVADHLRSAAKAAGAQNEDCQRFELHNLRHSLNNWLVNKAKVEPKTVQGILRHSKIQTTLDPHTQEDSDETRVVQGELLTAVGMSAMAT